MALPPDYSVTIDLGTSLSAIGGTDVILTATAVQLLQVVSSGISIPGPPPPATTSFGGSVPPLNPITGSGQQTHVYLRGDDTWEPLPETAYSSGSYTVPAVGSTVAVPIYPGDGWPTVGESVYFSGGGTRGFMEIAGSGASSLTLINRGNAPVGSVIPVNSIVKLAGLGQLTATAPGYVPLPPNNSLQVLQGNATWNYPVPWKKYNAIRNPEMIVAQRGVGSTIAANTASYTVDGWLMANIGTTVMAWGQGAAAIPADTSGNNWFPYIPYYLRAQITTASGTLATGNYAYIYQSVEGLLAESLKGGPTSISFLVRASITGTFSVAIRNPSVTYSIVYPVTIAAANVWQRVTIPNIPVFTSSATFPDGTAACYALSICLASGSTFITSTTGSWVAGNFLATTGQTNFAATVNNTFDITAVQHEPNPVCTPYIRRELADEMVLNTRYYNSFPAAVYIGFAFSAQWTYSLGYLSFPTMRVAPTLVSGSLFTASPTPSGTPVLGTSNTTAVSLYNGSNNWTVNASVSFTGAFTAEL